MVSNILVWSKATGFIQINEGSGENLTLKDEQQGYVDYVMVEFIRYDGTYFDGIDGGQVMLKELYQDKFEDETEVVQYLIENDEIPDADYYYLYAE